MRKLVAFTLGYGAVTALLASGAVQGGFLLAVFAAAAAFLLAGLKWKRLRPAALACFGCAAAIIWFGQYDRLYLSGVDALDGETMPSVIRVADYSTETDYGITADGTISVGGKTYQVRTYLEPTELLEPGDILSGEFLFRITVPGGEGESSYYQGKGIFLVACQKSELEVIHSGQTIGDYPAKLRREIIARLENCFSGDVLAFAKALLLGDTSGLTYGVDTDFKVSGIRHVVAVSGLHVSILFALLSTVTFRKRYLTALLGFPLLFLFAAVAGFTPSVTRACIMSGLMLLAQLVGREYDGPSALAFAVLVMLIVNPLVVTSVSLQLSVASVAGIFLFSADIRGWLQSLVGKTQAGTVKRVAVQWFSASVSITLSAMTLTTPLCAWYFGTVSLVGAVTNLLALWVISLIFYGLMAVCVLQWSWLAGLVALPIRYVLWVAKTMAGLPLAAVYTESVYIVIWLVFVYVLLIVFLFSRRRSPAVLGCCAAMGLCLALLMSWVEPISDDMRITVLDVGQGQCILLQSEGKTYMVDCGGDDDETAADLAARTLLSQGITKLDGLILTHCDRDHAGGAAYLLSRVDTELLILPPMVSGLEGSTEGEIVYADEDLLLSFGDARIQVFAATFPGSSNEMSLCILFDTKKCDILITGDRNSFGERMLLRNEEIPDVDVLIAGHHGAKDSTCKELLQAANPEIVCICAGEDNSYGHPAEELLLRLYEHGCSVYRTDIHGTITIRR